jgi:hypothetical protein
VPPRIIAYKKYITSMLPPRKEITNRALDLNVSPALPINSYRSGTSSTERGPRESGVLRSLCCNFSEEEVSIRSIEFFLTRD